MNGGALRVLLVEDEEILRVSLARELARAGHVVQASERAPDALQALAERAFDVVVADVRLPGMDGLALMAEAHRVRPGLPFVLMTAYATVRDAIRAMRMGAHEYLTKPFDPEDLLVLLERVRAAQALRDENKALRRRLEAVSRDDFLGASPALREVLDDLPLVARSDETVLITGETGTGKEYLARLIHVRGPRAEGPFVKVSCAAFNPGVIESELFGHERGAFTGAGARRVGRFERARGGTLMLDDIDDVRPEMQVKLLSVLQDGAIERVGGDQPIQIDVRVLAATKADLAQMVEEGQFRRDLYYRLNVLPMKLPPLRARPEDVPLLVDEFVRRHGQERPIRFAPEALDALSAYGWPGNIRELENLVKRLVALAPERPLGLDDLPAHVREGAAAARAEPAAAERGQYATTMARVERELFTEALRRTGGNVTRAAEDLGMAPSTLRDHLARLGIAR